MRRTLTNRERRGLALIILGLVLGAAYWLLVESWFAGPLREVNAQAQQVREQQQRYASVLGQSDALHAALERARTDPTTHDSLLPGDDPGAVAADLMQHVADLVSRHSNTGGGCTLTQRMPITVTQEQDEPYRHVKVSLTLACAIEPLTTILHALEYQRPFLFVDELSLRRAANAPANGAAGRLEVQLLVRGYLQAAPAGEVER